MDAPETLLRAENETGLLIPYHSLLVNHEEDDPDLGGSVIVSTQEAAEIAARWFQNGQADYVLRPNSHLAFTVTHETVEGCVAHLIDVCGGSQWVDQHEGVRESIPPDLFHNVGGYLEARAKQLRFRFSYRGDHIGLTEIDVFNLVVRARKAPGTPDVYHSIHQANLDRDLSWEDVEAANGGGGFCH